MAEGSGFSNQTDFPSLHESEWDAWKRLPPKKGITGFADSDRGIESIIRADPHGMTISPSHPELRKLPGDIEILRIPGEDGKLLVRPRQPAPHISEVFGERVLV